MAFQTPITIKEAIDNISSRKYVLPSIQREFVWKTEQIEKLFDSLMRGYPINSFLFWEVSSENKEQFKFYNFIKDYHERNNKHNEKADLDINSNIVSILDGQQRFTSLYIGLKGSYAEKIPYKRWDNPDAYPKKKLYLNLLKKSEDIDNEYEFKFLTEEEAGRNDEDNHWFEVSKILDYKEQGELNDYLISEGLFFIQDKNKSLFASRTICRLHEIIHKTGSISYYLEKSDELDKVLNIFIRVNSGGTTLSYSDLLLSFATAQWAKRDAREEIVSAVDEINDIGRGFNVDKDFILKACLVLCDFKDITFKVDNFNKDNMLKIEEEWDEVILAIKSAVRLISSFGFSRENMSSNNIIIPIAYYLKHIGLPNNFENKAMYSEERIKIKKWFVASLLKRVFSFMPDGILKPIREFIKNSEGNEFPLEEIVERFKGTNRTLVFNDEDVEGLLKNKYGKGTTLLIMSVIYPWADLRNNFHLDHMHPKSMFKRATLNKIGVDENDIEFYLENFNYIGNLQLLESTPNIEKSNSSLEEWISRIGSQEDITIYKNKHCIPQNISLDITNFKEFFDKRESVITERLKKELLYNI